MIEHVEEFATQLKLKRLVDRDVLGNVELPLLLTRTPRLGNVSAEVSEE